jgi:hypothetical protein
VLKIDDEDKIYEYSIYELQTLKGTTTWVQFKENNLFFSYNTTISFDECKIYDMPGDVPNAKISDNDAKACVEFTDKDNLADCTGKDDIIGDYGNAEQAGNDQQESSGSGKYADTSKSKLQYDFVLLRILHSIELLTCLSTIQVTQ